MKKISYLILCGLFLFSASAQAEIRSIVDWDGGNNPLKPGQGTIASSDDLAAIPNSCASRCSKPYSLTTTSCPPDQILVQCPVAGCSYYRLCRNKKNEFEKNTSNAVGDINAADVDLMELLDEIETYQYDQAQ